MEHQNPIDEEAKLDVPKEDSTDAVSHTDQYLETLMSSESGFRQYFCLIMKISYNLMIGGSTVALEHSFLTIELVLMANLSNSKILLPANTIAKIWVFPFWVAICQFNSGQTILVSRYLANNDYQAIKKVIKLHIHCLIGFYIFWLLIETIVYFTIQLIYPNQEELVKWVKINIILSFVLLFLTTIADFQRNLFVALGKRTVTLVYTLVTFGCIVFSGWLLGFYIGLDFWGVAIGLTISEVVQLFLYLIDLSYSKSFESFWKNIEKHSSVDEIFKTQAQEEQAKNKPRTRRRVRYQQVIFTRETFKRFYQNFSIKQNLLSFSRPKRLFLIYFKSHFS